MTCKPIPISISQVERQAFLLPLLGRPWRKGSDGPDVFDCWGLARHVEARLFARSLPGRSEDVASLAFAMASRAWRRTPTPVDGDIAVMGPVQARHVGVWLAIEGGILHAFEGPGVVFELPAVAMMRGYTKIRFFSPAC